MKGIQKHLVKIFWNVGGKRIAQRAAQKAIGRAIPVVGAVAGFGMDWHSLKKKGQLAIEYYESGVPVIIKSLATTHPPRLTLVSKGSKPNKSIVYIRGFLTGHRRQDLDWDREIRASGWQGNIYRFEWDSGDPDKAFPQKMPEFVKKFAYSVFWRKHRQNAKLIGSYYLPELISDSELFDADSITFVAHSLGTDMLKYGLHVWPPNDRSDERKVPRIERCILMGGVSEFGYEEWRELIEKFAHPRWHRKNPFLWNFYNPGDSHLLNKLPFGDGFQNLQPIGLYPIELFSPYLQNVDCSPWIGAKHKGAAYLTVVRRHKALFEPPKPKPKPKPQPAGRSAEEPRSATEPTSSQRPRQKPRWQQWLQRLRRSFAALWRKIRAFIVWLFTMPGQKRTRF